MSDLPERLRRLYVQAGTDYVQEAADELDRLTAALQYEQHRAGRQGTHGDGCADWGPAHYECAIRERDDLRRRLDECSQMLARQAAAIRDRDELRDVLLRNGFVPCDIPACNCGSWHHRYGLPERMQEIKDELAEAGHELSNANGNLTLNALKALVAERDELRRQLAEAEQDALRYRWLRRAREHWDILHRYDEDSRWIDLHGNDLDATIDAAMGGSNAG